MTPDQSGEWLELLARAAVPVGAALLGGLIGALGSARDRNAAVPLVHFAAGAFLGLALLHLLPEAAEQAGWGAALAVAVLGFALCQGLARRAGGACPACAAHPGLRQHLLLSGPLLWIVAVHSGLDGLALTSAGHAHHAGELLSVAIALHKLPEGLAITALCRAAGRGPGASLGLTAAVQACTFPGLLAGVLLGGAPGPWLGLSLGAVAGSFLYLVALTVRSAGETGRPLLNHGITLVGACLVLAARLALG